MNRKILACLLCLLTPSNFYGSVAFDGTDDYFDCGTFTFPSSAGMLAAWIKIDNSATVQLMHVISIGSSDIAMFQLSVTQSAADVTKFATYCNAYLPESGGSKDVTANCAAAQCITPGTWYHIACTNDVNTASLTPYINGVAYTAATAEGPPTGENHNLTFGNDVFFGAAYYYGEVADGIYVDGAPTTSDIETIAFSRMRNYVFPTDSGNKKQFYFPLDDFPDGTSVSGRTFIDRTGLGNSCTGSTGGTARADILRYP